MYFPRYKHLLTWHAASGSVDRTGILAAVEEVEGRSDHGAQQDVDVAPSPLGYGVLNVVLERTNKQDFSSLLFCWRSNMHRHHRTQGTVPRQRRVVSTHLRVIWSRGRSRKGSTVAIWILCLLVIKAAIFHSLSDRCFHYGLQMFKPDWFWQIFKKQHI